MKLISRAVGARPNWLLFYVVTTCLVLLFNYRAFQVDHAWLLSNFSDAVGIGHGYVRAVEEGVSWWTGPWINLNQPYFRPLASHVHFIQHYLSIGGYFGVVTLLSCLLYGLICVLCGRVAWKITSNRYAAWLSCLIAAVLGDGSPTWLACWIAADNWVVVFWSLLALNLMLDLLQQPSRSRLVLLWACVALACLTKEQGLVLAPCLAILAAIGVRTERSPALLRQLLGMTLAGMVYYRLTRVAMQTSTSALGPLEMLNRTLHNYQTRSLEDFIYLTDSWIASGIQLIILALPVFILWQANRHHPLLGLFLCARLATLPADSFGVPSLSMRFLVVWMWWAPMFGVAFAQIWQQLQLRGIIRPQKIPENMPQI